MKIKNANTVDGTLTNTVMTKNALTRQQLFYGPLSNIATWVELLKKTTGVHQVPWIKATTATGSAVTNYQTSGDTTLDNVALTVAKIVKRSHTASPEVNLGINLRDHILASLILDAEKDIAALVAVALTSANYGAADVSVTTANFGEDDTETMIAACNSGPRTMLVNTAARTGIADSLHLGAGDVWKYPGIDGGVYEVTTALGDAHTILAGPQALVFACERPEEFEITPPGEIMVQEVLLPTLKIPAWVATWIDRGTRTKWQSVESLFGVAAGDPAALSWAVTP